MRLDTTVDAPRSLREHLDTATATTSRRPLLTACLGCCLATATHSVAAASTGEPLRSIAAIQALPHESLAVDRHAVVQGTVTGKVDGGTFVVQEDDAAIFVVYRGPGSVIAIAPGDRVELEGKVFRGGYSPTLAATRIVRIGHEPPPPARPADLGRLMRGADNGLRVVATGVVQGVEDDAGNARWVLAVDCDARRVIVAVPKTASPQSPDHLIDAEIRFTGYVGSFRNSRGQFLSPLIVVEPLENLEVTRAAPADPFDQPSLPMAAIATFYDRSRTGHRICTEGTVSGVTPNRIYLQDGGVGVGVGLTAHAPDTDTAAVRPGDRVVVAGFRTIDRGRFSLEGSVIRRTGFGEPPPPSPVGPADIVRLDQQFRRSKWVTGAADYDSCRVQWRGRVVAITTAAADTRISLVSDGVSWSACLGPEAATDPRLPAVGSEVEIVGILQLDAPSAAAGDRGARHAWIETMTVVPQGLDDVSVVRAAPLWTTNRLGALAGVLAAVVTGSLAWVVMLRREVQRQAGVAVAEALARQKASDEYEVALRERGRIAADLHDTLLQTITGIDYALQYCTAGTGPPAGSSPDQLGIARTLAGHAIRQLRSTVWALRTMPDLRQPITDAISEMAHVLASGHDVRVDVRAAGEPRRVTEPVTRQLLFIVQEAMLNAMHHGRAACVTVTIRSAPESGNLEIMVRDDGSGFEPGRQPGPETGHFGIQGMRERAESFDGRFSIDSRPGSGTTVTVRVPAATCSGESLQKQNA